VAGRQRGGGVLREFIRQPVMLISSRGVIAGGGEVDQPGKIPLEFCKGAILQIRTRGFHGHSFDACFHLTAAPGEICRRGLRNLRGFPGQAPKLRSIRCAIHLHSLTAPFMEFCKKLVFFSGWSTGVHIGRPPHLGHDGNDSFSYQDD